MGAVKQWLERVAVSSENAVYRSEVGAYQLEHSFGSQREADQVFVVYPHLPGAKVKNYKNEVIRHTIKE